MLSGVRNQDPKVFAKSCSSNFEKTLAPGNCARVVLTFGREWISLNTLSFKGFKSTHIHTVLHQSSLA